MRRIAGNTVSPSRSLDGRHAARSTVGDTIAIVPRDTDANTLRGTVQIMVGQRTEVDGRWYELDVADDGLHVSARPIEPEMATLCCAA